MTEWRIETQATVRRIYFVEGADEREARERIAFEYPESSHDETEQVVSVSHAGCRR